MVDVDVDPTEAKAKTAPAGTWFDLWLGRHKARNPHSRFLVYEASPLGMGIYDAWRDEFREIGATRGELTKASKKLQAMAPTTGLLPEHHLPRLLAILRSLQVPRRRAEQDADHARARAEAEAARAGREHLIRAWSLLPDEDRQVYRQKAREANPAIGGLTGWVETMARLDWAAECGFAPPEAEQEPGPEPSPRVRPAPVEAETETETATDEAIGRFLDQRRSLGRSFRVPTDPDQALAS